MIDAVELLYTQADLDQYKVHSFSATELGKITGAADVNPADERKEGSKQPALFTTSTGVMMNYSFKSNSHKCSGTTYHGTCLFAAQGTRQSLFHHVVRFALLGAIIFMFAARRWACQGERGSQP